MAVVLTAVSMDFLTSWCSASARADQIQSRPFWAWTNFASSRRARSKSAMALSYCCLAPLVVPDDGPHGVGVDIVGPGADLLGEIVDGLVEGDDVGGKGPTLQARRL